jgi:hypothetical protein
MQTEKMREALQVIAEIRDSERLRQFMDSGRDRRCFTQVGWRYTNKRDC